MVTACSNILKIYTITENSIDLRLTSSFNDRIIELIRVPTVNFRLQSKDFKAPVAPKVKPQASKGKASRTIRRVVDIED